MSSWLEQLERELDARLSAFLRNNPVQEHLFSEQHLKDRAAAALVARAGWRIERRWEDPHQQIALHLLLPAD